jgi:hypothetical protein
MRVLDSYDSPQSISYHGVNVRASYTQLSLAFGQGEILNDDKVSYEWICETEDGRKFTIYDWKEGRFSDDQVIEWHIGSDDLYSSLVAKDEIIEEMMLKLSEHYPNDQLFGYEIRRNLRKKI